MREEEAGRPRVPWRSYPWLKQISSVAARVSTAALTAAGATGSLAARKRTNRNHDRDAEKDDQARDRDTGKSRESDRSRETDRGQDRDVTRERSNSTDNDDGRHHDRNRERQESGSGDENRDVRKAQNNNNNNDDPDATATPEPTDTGGGGGGGNGGGGDGGGGGGGGNNAGNAGSGFFDSPLATKARRRSNDFENGDRDAEDDEIVVDVNPDGESVYETDSIFFATGPDGLEILTENITFTAAPTPTPTPLPTLELPVREAGYPFGEDFPFGAGSPFDATAVTTAPTTTEPVDPGDTPRPARAEPVSEPVDSVPTATDGGDNTMDFTS